MEEEEELTNWAWLRILDVNGTVLFDCVHALTNRVWGWEWTEGEHTGTALTVSDLFNIASWVQNSRRNVDVVGHFANQFAEFMRGG